MKKSIFFIALLMIVAIGVHPGYCAKRKSVSKADTEKKASESGSVYVFPTDAEKRPFKPARRVCSCDYNGGFRCAGFCEPLSAHKGAGDRLKEHRRTVVG